jgi:alpha-D-xyloside xylohydrolase
VGLRALATTRVLTGFASVLGGVPERRVPDEISFQNDPVDPAEEFKKQQNHFFVAERVERLDSTAASGALLWKRMSLIQRVSYHQVTLQFEDFAIWKDQPEREYADEQGLPFALDFISSRCVRVRVAARPGGLGDGDSIMLERCEPGEPWRREDREEGSTWRGPCGSIAIRRDPWCIELRDAEGRLLTRTPHHTESPGVVNSYPMPFCYARSASSFHRHLAASLALSPNERLYGCGESFTRLDKRGQLLHMWTRDAYSAQTPFMYKPVPFFLSSGGWGVFAHTAAPATFDLGHSHDSAAVLYLAADVADLFLFLGEPKEIVSEYTALTGRARMPPRWSFGLWMGRDSYESAEEVRAVGRRLREERVPCDVLHLDTAWTERKFRMDFEFSPSRFPEPERLLSELRDNGFRVSLWQFPYLHPRDDLHTEAIAKELVVLASDGLPPVDDAVIDLTSEQAIEWYQAKLRRLLEQGVAVFTSDFGEAAPFGGIYRDDPAGFEEHNLYPLRYAQAVAEVTEDVTGEWIQHLRSGWAGAQRYPVHFSGDPETSNGGMLGTLRGGLSLGLCGFTFWTHFVAGFPKPPDADLYLRWLAFGVLSSHVRCHGAPPREPWELGPQFLAGFRRLAELRYSLLPYVVEQAQAACERGHPLLRPLFFEFPNDPGSWLVEDQYLLGDGLLVAPLLERAERRQVYLPPGRWQSFDSGEAFDGPGWYGLRIDEIPAAVLVRDGTSLRLAEPAQHTGELDWDGATEWHP